MNHWTYKNSVISSVSDIPQDAKYVGFIYIITQLSTGKKYIGRKMLWSNKTKQVNGKKKKIQVESDWLNYWSSSPKIQAWIEAAGNADDFKKEILVFCKSKGSMTYLEESALYQVGALLSDDWINDNIRSKVYRTWIHKDIQGAHSLKQVLQDKGF